MDASISNITVSVIIPTRNRSELLQKAVQSVLNQTYQNFEIIIIDDASMPPIKSYPDSRIRILRNDTPLGGSASRNRGIFASLGLWIAFLDDDDIWQPQKLAQQLQMLEKNPKAIAATCTYTVHYPFSIKRQIVPLSPVTLAKLLESNCLGGASVCMCDARTIKQFGGLNSSLRSAQDWDLWVKLRMQGEIVRVNMPLVDYFVHFRERISNNMQAKYQGSRRFYFTYQTLMTPIARKRHLQFICFIKSRQNNHSLRLWFKHLWLAMRDNPLKIKLAYFFSSAPRMLINLLYVSNNKVNP